MGNIDEFIVEQKHKMSALFFRVTEKERAGLGFYVDGIACEALEGDTVLTAVLSITAHVRRSEFSDRPRAGFCMMGACQDCWMWLETGERIRACTTLVRPDMRLLTHAGGLS